MPTLSQIRNTTCVLGVALINLSILPARAADAAAALTDTQAQSLARKLLAQSGSPGAALTDTQAQALVHALRDNQNAAAPAPPALPVAAARKPGSVRIGVVAPQAQVTESGHAAAVSEPVRSELLKYLTGPALEATPITALLPAQIETEATQKECDYVLYTSIAQKKGGSSKAGFLHGASSMAGRLPMFGAGRGIGQAVAVTAAQSAMSGISEATSMVKAKDEWTLGYKLVQPGSAAPVVANTATAKAGADGEDVITPLLRQASEAIAAQAVRK